MMAISLRKYFALQSFMRTRLSSFNYAANGLRRLVQNEHNARIHFAISLTAIAAGWTVQLGRSDWCWMIAAMALVWMAEGFNTAIEDLCDRISPEFDPAIGQVKDMAAGAVLVAAAAAALIGLLIFFPRIVERLS